MRKNSAYFLLSWLFLNCLFAGFAQTKGVQETQIQTDQEDAQSSRELDDDVWKKKRKPQRVQAKRRKYTRVGVANSSATAQIRKRKPNASNVSNAPGKIQKPTGTWQDIALNKSEQVGVTIWRLRKCITTRPQCFISLRDEHNNAFQYEALRVNTESDFHSGDGIQLAIESPINGFIYIVHQEVYEDGNTSNPKFLYPLREGVNAVTPGRPLLIPTQVAGGGVKVLRMSNDKGKKLKAERLKIIITPKPIDGIFAQEKPRLIVDSDIKLWESEWSGRLELFDLNGGDEENMSPNEWYAMQSDNNGSRDLTTEDLAPQRLYVVERKGSNGIFVSLDLPYGK